MSDPISFTYESTPAVWRCSYDPEGPQGFGKTKADALIDLVMYDDSEKHNQALAGAILAAQERLERENAALREVAAAILADMGMAEWGTNEHGATLFFEFIQRHHKPLREALSRHQTDSSVTHPSGVRHGASNAGGQDSGEGVKGPQPEGHQGGECACAEFCHDEPVGSRKCRGLPYRGSHPFSSLREGMSPEAQERAAERTDELLRAGIEPAVGVLRFPRATSQPLGTEDWVIDVPFLKHVRRAAREKFGDYAMLESLCLEAIEQALLAAETVYSGYALDQHPGPRCPCPECMHAYPSLRAEESVARDEPPPGIRAALLVLLNHVEPGWDNCKFAVQAWLDERLELPEQSSQGTGR